MQTRPQTRAGWPRTVAAALVFSAAPSFAAEIAIPAPRPDILRAAEDLAEELIEAPAVTGEAEGPASGTDILVEAALEPVREDLDALVARGLVRFAVAPDPILIAFDGAAAIGAAIDASRELEAFLSERIGRRPTVAPIPVPRGEIRETLADGRVDFAALPVDPFAETDLAFTRAIIEDVEDLAILNPDLSPDIETLDDLAETGVYVSRGSPYEAALLTFNAERLAAGEPVVPVRTLDPVLDDYDLMEMVEVGLLPATVMSRHKAALWSQVYEEAVVRDDLVLREGGQIAWATRPDAPELNAALDAFVDRIAKGTLLGNILFKRYFTRAERIENIGTPERRALIDEVEPVIRRYAERFAFDSDLVLAQAYQESRLDQNARSHVGAIGVMQVMPATAADPVVGLPDITDLDTNVHAGVKYLRYLRDQHFDDPAIDDLNQTLLSFAAYNAGPGNLRKAQRKAAELGLDPNVWFENVEIAIAQTVSREPVVYVRNIFKYVVAYRLLKEIDASREATVADLETDGPASPGDEPDAPVPDILRADGPSLPASASGFAPD
ncbi:MAG: transglycosylase SLT domain-containing protein [Pseudomonadota bacterium]